MAIDTQLRLSNSQRPICTDLSMAEATQRSSSETVSVLLVTDGGDPPDVQARSNYKPHRARYTKSMLRSTLQLMGCKPRTAHKVRKHSSISKHGAVPSLRSFVSLQVSERVYRVLDEELNGAGRDLLPASLSPLQDRLQRSEGDQHWTCRHTLPASGCSNLSRLLHLQFLTNKKACCSVSPFVSPSTSFLPLALTYSLH